MAGLLSAGRKTLPSRYLYDDVGSALFEVITLLPEYGLTRADSRLLARHSSEIVGELSPNLLVAELGSGSGTKTRHMLEAAVAQFRIRPLSSDRYFPGGPAAVPSRAGDHTGVEIRPVEASYLDGLAETVQRRHSGQAVLLLFLGSTIGNFAPREARAFHPSNPARHCSRATACYSARTW